MNRLAAKVAIVTGAASGIGRASAIRLAKEGASVVVAAENLAKYSANILVPEHGTPDDARFVTGEVIRVDGGMQSHITTLGHLRPSLKSSLAPDGLPC